MSTYRDSHRPTVDTEAGAFYKAATLLLGLAVVGMVALLLWADARQDRDTAGATAAAAAPASEAHEVADHNTALPLASFAGVVPENAIELAEAHPAYDAVLPPAPAGDVVKVQMTLKDMTVEVAPGVEYNTWAFDGHGAPGPVVHVREGQTVEMTLTNGGGIPHSIDFRGRHVPLRLARVRGCRPRPGRSPEGREPQGDDAPLRPPGSVVLRSGEPCRTGRSQAEVGRS